MLNIDDLHADRRRADAAWSTSSPPTSYERAEALRDLPAVAAVRALRAAARGRRPATSRSSSSSSTRRTCCSTTRRRSLLDKIEQVVRLIRSKGVGVYFVTQNPLDVPDTVLGQLGNRVQHALRAFTPRDQKAVKAAAETMRANPRARHREGDHRARRSARRWSRSSTRRAARRSSSARSSCRRRAASGPITRGGAASDDRSIAACRRLREGRRPRVGVRKAQGPRGARPRPAGEASAAPAAGAAGLDSVKDSLGRPA